MELGAFSISLNVKDLQKSKAFYENLGFETLGGDMNHNYLILKNGQTLIGLFQGLFEKNILTFNPGWDNNAKNLENFTDVRDLQKELKKKGMGLIQEADDSTSGPAYVTLEDPDGNPILIDQHR
ncbi:VOC family protein [Oceanobacillus halophilus]|uniref:VOC family protein n=1 Tax=Oceanobacillus halophilus TaxID=930130 RepID=A0A494ZUG8_9BACI|nr:VOC family protein [Oceanobacillus halophilus]RKQ29972.1 VOC family protein [Oceanobacillus halophilus]